MIHDNDFTEIDHAFLDKGRRDFEAMVERLRSFCDRDLRPEGRQLLQEIEMFLCERFSFESRVMLYNRHEDLAIHHQQHQLMLESLSWSITTVRKENQISHIVCDFLADWFRVHSEVLDAELCGLKIPDE